MTLPREILPSTAINQAACSRGLCVVVRLPSLQRANQASFAVAGSANVIHLIASQSSRRASFLSMPLALMQFPNPCMLTPAYALPT